MNNIEIKPDFSKSPDGLVPVVVQDANTLKVLMLGYMNNDALAKTLNENKVTFYSRSKNRLWTKGETSGHYLMLKSISVDCDLDTILIKAIPIGPVCHTGKDTCFNEKNNSGILFLQEIEEIIESRRTEPNEKSYVSSLFKKGINKIAQKVGEEAVEVVIEAKDINDDLFKNEAADLLFHLLILLQAKGFRLNDITDVLKERHQEKQQ
jgi:phosphoribosyl-ATP pyrophosphohydrolase/phosphoribosyl-AMP cyclohydrolase